MARALADEDTEGLFAERKVQITSEKDGILGLGLKASKQTSVSSMPADSSLQPSGNEMKDTTTRLFGTLSAKPTTYLSQFILHIAAIGDIVDGTDTTHDFNFFSVVFEWPKDVSETVHVFSGNLIV